MNAEGIRYGPGEARLRAALRRLRREEPRALPAGLPGDLCERLELALLTCAPAEVGPLFVDARIAPWRDLVPDGGTAIDRARALIAALVARSNAAGENALVLFLAVLADRTPVADACFKRLCLLQAELRGEMAK